MDAILNALKKTLVLILNVAKTGRVMMESVSHLKMGLLVMMEIQLQKVMLTTQGNVKVSQKIVVTEL